VRFYVGLHMPNHAEHFDRCMVSVNRLRNRRSDFLAREWVMDSGAFTEVTKHGGYRHDVEEYAEQVNRWARCGSMVAATAQDWMCEPFAIEATGKSVAEHQALTVERYAALLPLADAYVLPVLQGWLPADYASHVRQYGALLRPGQWVGVGSVCKRNTNVGGVEAVLRAILGVRPDLRLHGFGLKLTALRDAAVRSLLYSADSMAWSYAARRGGRNQNDWREARAFCAAVERQPRQRNLWEAA
jgi:hypothetical protein